MTGALRTDGSRTAKTRLPFGKALRICNISGARQLGTRWGGIHAVGIIKTKGMESPRPVPRIGDFVVKNRSETCPMRHPRQRTHRIVHRRGPATWPWRGFSGKVGSAPIRADRPPAVRRSTGGRLFIWITALGVRRPPIDPPGRARLIGPKLAEAQCSVRRSKFSPPSPVALDLGELSALGNIGYQSRVNQRLCCPYNRHILVLLSEMARN
jgi:hypothetical protein